MKQLHPQQFKEGDWAFDVRHFKWGKVKRSTNPQWIFEVVPGYSFDSFGINFTGYSQPTFYSIENAKLIFDSDPPVEVPKEVFLNMYGDDEPCVHLTRESADADCTDNRIGGKAYKYVLDGGEA